MSVGNHGSLSGPILCQSHDVNVTRRVGFPCEMLLNPMPEALEVLLSSYMLNTELLHLSNYVYG